MRGLDELLGDWVTGWWKAPVIVVAFTRPLLWLDGWSSHRCGESCDEHGVVRFAGVIDNFKGMDKR